MLATLDPDAPLQDARFAYEPKYDGIRGLVEIEPGGRVHIWSRLGNEKTAQFPEIARALESWARPLGRALVIDGEIVALNDRGEPIGFQNLQGRIHLASVADDPALAGVPVAFIAFDVLRDGDDDLTAQPLSARRARLEKLFARARSPVLRISAFVPGNGRALYDDAVARGWEGLIAKHLESPYRPGKRTSDWRKIKIVRRQEFVVGGWTEARGTRPYFGALLLGVYDGGSLKYAGHTGSGFDDRELARVAARLTPLERRDSPFRERPKTNERPHWVDPALVVEVKFTEWTADEKLRHPIYVGMRDDVDPLKVVRERAGGGARAAGVEGPAHASRAETTVRASRGSARTESPRAAARPARTAAGSVRPGPVEGRTAPRTDAASARAGRAGSAESVRPEPVEGPTPPLNAKIVDALIAQVDAIDDKGGDGFLALPDGHSLQITNLAKIFWPRLKLAKGDLLRYYIRAAPYLLPAIADRPLVMKRFPNGLTGQTFYQQRAPDHVPRGVRVETLPDDDVPSRLVGGSLVTLLYMTQLAAISQDPWFSRVQSPRAVDHVAIDLDPPDGVSFATVLDVARWVHDELRFLGVEGYPKTSGADGLHIYIPMPPDTPYEAGMIFAQIIATMVARKHPKQATVERAVRARSTTAVYVDYLQNIHGKTLATAYSARASDYAGAATPLTWKEIHAGVDREDFTIRTLPARLKKVGDLWARLLRSPGVDLRCVEKYAT